MCVCFVEWFDCDLQDRDAVEKARPGIQGLTWPTGRRKR